MPDPETTTRAAAAAHPERGGSHEAAVKVNVAIDPKDQRIGQLRLALLDAIEQLEGWVSWKCPRAHKRQHQDYIEKLRLIASAEPGEVVDFDPEDGARLNWLEANVNLAIHGHCRVADAVDEFEVLDPDGDLSGTGTTLRAAIDDARGVGS